MDINWKFRRSDSPFAGTEGLLALQYYTIASISFLYYDHIITFSQEIRNIWKRKLSILNILFIINRYTTCFGYVPIAYFTFNSPSDIMECSRFVRFPAALSITTQVIISVIVILRCHALYNGHRGILVSVSILGLALLASFIWATTTFVGVDLSFGGLYRTCLPGLTRGQNDPYKVSWLLSIVFDSVAFILILVKTVQMRRVYQFQGSYGSVANLFLRDGSIYFAVIAMSYIIHIILYLKLQDAFFTVSMGNNAFLTHAISVTMISRLILNLKSYPERHARQLQGVIRNLEIPNSAND